MPKFIAKLILTITIAVSAFFTLQYGRNADPFYGDGFGYYIYLPTAFIYHNFLSIEVVPDALKDYGNVVDYARAMNGSPRTPKGYIIDQYTYGVAFFELPFFLIAHAYEKLNSLPANGYTDTYLWLLHVGFFLFTLWGLWLVYKILLHYYDKHIAIITTCLVLAGTNLFWFAFFQVGMSHPILFFLFALLIWGTIRLYQRPEKKYFILTGLTCGFIILIRPTDIICLLIPLLFGVYNKKLFIERVQFIKQHFRSILLFTACCIVPMIPQFIYWKIISGHFVYYSYGNQSFEWTTPHIIPGLFSFNNGWLAYTPLMAFALLGLFFYKKLRDWNWILWLSLPIYIYVIYCWYCFSYINGFGSRPMVDIYALLALPLAAMVHAVMNKKMVLPALFTAICLFFVSVNVTQSMQQARWLMVSETSNMSYNLSTLYKTEINLRDMVCYDVAQVQPHLNKITKLATIGELNFEDSTSAQFERDTVPGSKYVYHMKEEEYPDTRLKVRYSKDQFKDAKWIKCSGRFMNPDRGVGYFKHLLVCEIKRGDQMIDWHASRIESQAGLTDSSCGHRTFTLHHIETRIWSLAYFFIKVPEGMQDGDEIHLNVWNTAHVEMYADNLKLELYK